MSASALRKEIQKLKSRIGEISSTARVEITDAAEWAERISGLTLDEWQRRVLSSDAARLLLLCSRQSGKSEVVSLLASAIAAGGGSVIVVSPSQRQSNNLFRRIRQHLRHSGAKIIRETATELSLAGGGNAISLPGNMPHMLRGLSLRHDGASALIVDECCYVKDALWQVASPMLAAADGARMILLSTPAGPSGEFYRMWSDNEFNAERVTVKANDCPRISPEYLAEEKARLGVLFEQEYLCGWLASVNSIFNSSLLASMFATPIEAAVENDEAAIDWDKLLSMGSGAPTDSSERAAEDVLTDKQTPLIKRWSF